MWGSFKRDETNVGVSNRGVLSLQGAAWSLAVCSGGDFLRVANTLILCRPAATQKPRLMQS